MIEVFILTLIVLLLCCVCLGLGLFFKRGALRKCCSAEPQEPCRCQDGGCDRDHSSGKI